MNHFRVMSETKDFSNFYHVNISLRQSIGITIQTFYVAIKLLLGFQETLLSTLPQVKVQPKNVYRDPQSPELSISAKYYLVLAK